jgi:hypothetical protein
MFQLQNQQNGIADPEYRKDKPNLTSHDLNVYPKKVFKAKTFILLSKNILNIMRIIRTLQ